MKNYKPKENLEGKYVLFAYKSSYYGDANNIEFEIFKINNNQLIEVFNPVDSSDHLRHSAINYLLENNVKQVYTPKKRVNTLLEEPLSFFEKGLKEFNELDTWVRYLPLSKHKAYCIARKELIEENNIKLNYFDIE